MALEPASSIIEKFGGPDQVRAITGVSRTRVYRWTQPKDRGGTDGTIPQPHISKLLSYAREHGIQVSAEAFLISDRAA